MKITEELVDILSSTDKKLCAFHIVKEEKRKAICVITERAICEMSISALEHCKKFRKNIESVEFEVNPCDSCVIKKMADEFQMITCWHVDDSKISHRTETATDEFID